MSRVAQLVLMVLLVATAQLVPHRSPVAHAVGSLQVLATVGGQPDDITVDTHGRLVWGDLASGTLDRLQNGHVVSVVRGLSVPEGLVALHNGSFLVAEQGRDQIDLIGRRGVVSVVSRLVPVAGQEGVDAIGYDARTGTILVPDSPHGTVLKIGLHSRTVQVFAQGLGRPVDAKLDTHGNVLVPDEHLGTLVVISPRGSISHRGTFSTPDDVAVDGSGRIWVTSLGDDGLWVIAPHAAPRRVLSGLADPQGLTLDRCGDPIVVEQGAARIVRLLLTSSSHRCAL